jgi:predicted nucleotidyltransferase
MSTIVPIMGTMRSPSRMSLADALFSRTQQRVLGILFGEPEKSFYANEIFRRAGPGRGAVQRELQRLEESKLAVVTRIGNQKHYRANQDAPIFAELRSIMAKTAGVADPISKALAPLKKKIELAFVYGSVARGEAHAGSDVDLLIVAGDLTLEKVYARLAAAESIIGRKINALLFTPREFRHRRANGNAFLAKVLSGEMIPLIGPPDAEA